MKMRSLLIPISAYFGWMVFVGCVSPGVPDEIEVTREVPVTVVVEKEVPGLETFIAEWKPVELPMPVTVVVEPVKVPVPQTVVVEKEVVVEVPVPVTVVTENVVEVPVTVTVIGGEGSDAQSAAWHAYTMTDFIKVFGSYEVPDPEQPAGGQRGISPDSVCKGYPEQELTDWQHLLIWYLRFFWWVDDREIDLKTTDLTNAGLCTRLVSQGS